MIARMLRTLIERASSDGPEIVGILASCSRQPALPEERRCKRRAIPECLGHWLTESSKLPKFTWIKPLVLSLRGRPDRGRRRSPLREGREEVRVRDELNERWTRSSQRAVPVRS